MLARVWVCVCAFTKRMYRDAFMSGYRIGGAVDDEGDHLLIYGKTYFSNTLCSVLRCLNGYRKTVSNNLKALGAFY